MDRGWPDTDAGGSGPLIAVVGLFALLVATPAATAQVFIASQPKPVFGIGPPFLRANVGPAPGPLG